MAQPTPELQDTIESCHAAIAAEADPKHKAILGQCLTQMMKIQAEHMQADDGTGSNGGQQAPQQPGLDQALPPQGPPPDLSGGADPRLAMLAQLGGGGV